MSITPELERFVQDLVASGRYQSASEVFREGLRLLEQTERKRLLEKWLVEGIPPQEQSQLPTDLLERVRSQIEAKIQEGLDAISSGSVVDGQAFFDRWRARLARPARPSKRSRSRVKRKA